ncbi:hypothetical protein BDZ45DRAFT_55503 [Acephala macrosclerotiorum]|nr:hypothetical protein BDZ45DRAFT_55503 [Acephala macrosclerotiorum]
MIVGAQKSRMKCHKILLSFYSRFFNGALNGNFAESGKSDIDLPEDDVEAVRTFVQWVYTGDVYFGHEHWFEEAENHALANTEPEKVWIFGDKILAPKFANEMMYAIFEKQEDVLNERLQPHVAEYVFANTAPKAELRSFVVDRIQACGPFNPEDKSNENAWLATIAKGGDLVVDCMRGGGFHNFTEDYPQDPVNWHKYMQTESQASVDDWLKKHSRSDK